MLARVFQQWQVRCRFAAAVLPARGSVACPRTCTTAVISVCKHVLVLCRHILYCVAWQFVLTCGCLTQFAIVILNPKVCFKASSNLRCALQEAMETMVVRVIEEKAEPVVSGALAPPDTSLFDSIGDQITVMGHYLSLLPPASTIVAEFCEGVRRELPTRGAADASLDALQLVLQARPGLSHASRFMVVLNALFAVLMDAWLMGPCEAAVGRAACKVTAMSGRGLAYARLERSACTHVAISLSWLCRQTTLP